MAISRPRIFLSHSHKDHEFCIRIVEDLRRVLGDDDAVWYDASGGLQGGDAWWYKIEQELRARTTFIVVLSPDATASAWVNDEINIAWQRKNHSDPASRMRFIPVLYRPCTIRPSLESLQVVSFLPPKSYNVAFQEILIALGLPRQAAGSQNTPLAPQDSATTSAQGQQAIPPFAVSPDTISALRPLAAKPEAIGVFRTLTGHTQDVLSVAMSADGLTLVSRSLDQTIKLWDVQKGKLLYTLKDSTKSVALNADGLILATVSYGDGTIKLWNTQTGTLLRTLIPPSGTASSVALSADGKTLAAGNSDGKINIWTVKEQVNSPMFMYGQPAILVPGEAGLYFLAGPLRGTTQPINKPFTTLGRAPDNDIIIPDPGVSRYHARIIVQNGSQWLIEKLSPNNTVRVNSRDVQQEIISDRDSIALGKGTTFLFFR